ncbi:MAG: cation transporter [Nitrosomonadales bacterium]|nr:MAG: cation transporter [Nitrosomonadales bacterium]
MSDAFSPDALARQIVVRYRGAGHVRFQLPEALCEEHNAAAIEDGLRNQPGVYRVTLYRKLNKLSVFYHPHACELHDVARCLRDALKEAGAPGESAKSSLMQRLRSASPAGWIKAKAGQARAKVEEWKFKARLMGQIVSYHPQINPMLKSMFTERAILNFANDIVTFYLIKVHWDLITQKWVRQPFKYRNAWLTTFYLVFLLVRSRKQAAKKP